MRPPARERTNGRCWPGIGGPLRSGALVSRPAASARAGPVRSVCQVRRSEGAAPENSETSSSSMATSRSSRAMANCRSAVRETSLIVSAVDRVGRDRPASQLAPGTILLDNSYPPTFDPAVAWQRMNESYDVIIASGGFARLPGPVRETFYVPNSARPFLAPMARTTSSRVSARAV